MYHVSIQFVLNLALTVLSGMIYPPTPIKELKKKNTYNKIIVFPLKEDGNLSAV